MFKEYPKDKKTMLMEIRRAFDAYDNNDLTNEAFVNLIRHYEEYSNDEQWLGTYHDCLVDDCIQHEFEANKQTHDRLGKKRTRRLEKILAKYSEIL